MLRFHTSALAVALCLAAANQAFAADIKTGTVVIGSGVAGMKTAIKLKEANADVLVIEKMAFPGGSTNLAAQYLAVVNKKEQQAAGKVLTTDGFIERQKKVDPQILEHRVRAEMNDSQRTLDYLNGLGANITRVLSDYQMGIADGSSLGTAVVRVMTNRMNELKVEMRLGTKAESLITKNGKVVGVKVKSEDGDYNIYADNVVLATGGFAASQTVISKYAPEWKDLPTTSAVGSTGDGITMTEPLGVRYEHMDIVRMNPSVSTHNGTNSSLSAARAEGGIMVNLNGKRFCNDYFPDYTTMSRWLMEQPEGKAYIVIDDKSMKASKRLQKFLQQGYFLQDNTVAGLAEKMGAPARTLQETVKNTRAS